MRTLTEDRQVRKVTGSIRNPALEKFPSVRQYTEYICEPLTIEDMVIQPAAFISPPKWHLGHTTWFFEEFILRKHYPNYRHFHPLYAFFFGTQSESHGSNGMQSAQGNYSRPTVEEVFQYRAYVDEHMNWLLQDFPDDGVTMLEAGIRHEQRHQELLYGDIKYILGHNPLFPPYKKEVRETPHLEHEHHFIPVAEGKYQIGRRRKEVLSGIDGEPNSIFLRSYRIRKSLVTNHEYLQFILEGGYQRPEYWLIDGWEWINDNGIVSPLYWHIREGDWCRYALSGLERINPEEPVTHVSFYEAAAFAKWKRMRLPTEFEWEAAADKLPWGLRWEHTYSAFLPSKPR